MRGSQNGYWIEVLAGTNGLFTCGTNPSAGNVIVIGSVTYRFESTLAQANDVKIGADANTTLAHLVATLNGTGVAGVDFYAGTVSPATEVSAGAVDTVNHTTIVSARTLAASGLTSTSNVSGATWTAATLTSGAAVADLQRQSPDGSWRNTMITQISGLGSAQTVVLPPGAYQIVSTYGISAWEISRIPSAVE